MKKIIISGIVGLAGGLVGALIFQPIEGIFSILFSDFTLGGIIVGIASALLVHKVPAVNSMGKSLLFSALVGMGVFLIFGLLSGKLVDDMIAGAIIGLVVGLVNHFLRDEITELVEKTEDYIESKKA